MGNCKSYTCKQEREALQSENERLAASLSNLLARVHRDGGHYESEYGTDKACADADLIVAGLYARAEASAAVKVPTVVRQAADFTREDLGPDGTNYPHVRAMLAFIESLTTQPATPQEAEAWSGNPANRISPPAQAVTEAQVEAAQAVFRKHGWTYQAPHIREALTAAQEASR